MAYSRGLISNFGIFLKGWHKKKNNLLNEIYKQITRRLFLKQSLLVDKNFFIVFMTVVYLFAFLSPVKGSNIVLYFGGFLK